MNRYRNSDWVRVGGGHRDLAVSTIPRISVFIVQLNFLHLYPRDGRPEAPTPNNWMNNCSQLVFSELLLFTALNYSNMQRLPVKHDRQLITSHVKTFGYVSNKLLHESVFFVVFHETCFNIIALIMQIILKKTNLI